MNKIQKFLIEAVLAAFFILFLCFLIGYFANGLHKYTFDLNSVWVGVAAIAAGGVLAVLKYAVDSFGNSEPGKMPYDKEEK